MILRPISLTLLLLAACSREAPKNTEKVTRDAAIKISRNAAAAHGYDLNKYQLSSFGSELAEDQSEWLIGYVCSPGPPPPAVTS
jgi:hypothetical protein